MDTNADVVVMGAGLAGLSVAVALSDLGWKTIVIEKNIIGCGASGVPIGLINPAAAKQANLSWNAELCIAAISELLERAHPYAEREFFKKTGVLRPSVDSATYDAFSTSLLRHQYPNGWARWMDIEELEALQLGLVHAGGALWVNEGYTVDVTSYLIALTQLLLSNGVDVSTENELKSITWLEDVHKWKLLMGDGKSIQTSHVIYANGASILDDPDWAWLPLHKIKGQVAVYKSDDVLNWSHAIAGRGYIAHLNGTNWAVGSTFEHIYEHAQPDEPGLNYLEQKVDKMLPDLRSCSILQSQWAGIRMGTPNRLPIVGRHPKIQGKSVFTGLGSKGLLLSAYLGQVLAANLVVDSSIPTEVCIKRHYNEL